TDDATGPELFDRQSGAVGFTGQRQGVTLLARDEVGDAGEVAVVADDDLRPAKGLARLAGQEVAGAGAEPDHEEPALPRHVCPSDGRPHRGTAPGSPSQ